MSKVIHTTRENWLIAATALLGDIFKTAGHGKMDCATPDDE